MCLLLKYLHSSQTRCGNVKVRTCIITTDQWKIGSPLAACEITIHLHKTCESTEQETIQGVGPTDITKGKLCSFLWSWSSELALQDKQTTAHPNIPKCAGFLKMRKKAKDRKPKEHYTHWQLQEVEAHQHRALFLWKLQALQPGWHCLALQLLAQILQH